MKTAIKSISRSESFSGQENKLNLCFTSGRKCKKTLLFENNESFHIICMQHKIKMSRAPPDFVNRRLLRVRSAYYKSSDRNCDITKELKEMVTNNNLYIPGEHKSYLFGVDPDPLNSSEKTVEIDLSFGNRDYTVNIKDQETLLVLGLDNDKMDYADLNVCTCGKILFGQPHSSNPAVWNKFIKHNELIYVGPKISFNYLTFHMVRMNPIPFSISVNKSI